MPSDGGKVGEEGIEGEEGEEGEEEEEVYEIKEILLDGSKFNQSEPLTFNRFTNSITNTPPSANFIVPKPESDRSHQNHRKSRTRSILSPTKRRKVGSSSSIDRSRSPPRSTGSSSLSSLASSSLVHSSSSSSSRSPPLAPLRPKRPPPSANSKVYGFLDVSMKKLEVSCPVQVCCVIGQYGGQYAISPTSSRSTSWEWNEPFSFVVFQRTEPYHIQLHSFDRLGGTSLIGVKPIPWSELDDEEAHEKKFEFPLKGNRTCTVEVELQFVFQKKSESYFSPVMMGFNSHLGNPITEIPQRFQTGDIILFQTNRIAARMTARMTASKWDHVAMVVVQAGEVQLLEALLETGVAFTPLSRVSNVLEGGGKVGVRHLEIHRSPAFVRKLNAYVQTVIGRPYEQQIGTYIRAGLGKSKATPQENASLFCSQLIAAAYVAMGLLPSEGKLPGDYLPKDFSKKLKLVNEHAELGKITMFEKPPSWALAASASLPPPLEEPNSLDSATLEKSTLTEEPKPPPNEPLSPPSSPSSPNESSVQPPPPKLNSVKVKERSPDRSDSSSGLPSPRPPVQGKKDGKGKKDEYRYELGDTPPPAPAHSPRLSTKSHSLPKDHEFRKKQDKPASSPPSPHPLAPTKSHSLPKETEFQFDLKDTPPSNDLTPPPSPSPPLDSTRLEGDSLSFVPVFSYSPPPPQSSSSPSSEKNSFTFSFSSPLSSASSVGSPSSIPSSPSEEVKENGGEKESGSKTPKDRTGKREKRRMERKQMNEGGRSEEKKEGTEKEEKDRATMRLSFPLSDKHCHFEIEEEFVAKARVTTPPTTTTSRHTRDNQIPKSVHDELAQKVPSSPSADSSPIYELPENESEAVSFYDLLKEHAQERSKEKRKSSLTLVNFLHEENHKNEPSPQPKTPRNGKNKSSSGISPPTKQRTNSTESSLLHLLGIEKETNKKNRQQTPPPKSQRLSSLLSTSSGSQSKVLKKEREKEKKKEKEEGKKVFLGGGRYFDVESHRSQDNQLDKSDDEQEIVLLGVTPKSHKTSYYDCSTPIFLPDGCDPETILCFSNRIIIGYSYGGFSILSLTPPPSPHVSRAPLSPPLSPRARSPTLSPRESMISRDRDRERDKKLGSPRGVTTGGGAGGGGMGHFNLDSRVVSLLEVGSCVVVVPEEGELLGVHLDSSEIIYSKKLLTTHSSSLCSALALSPSFVMVGDTSGRLSIWDVKSTSIDFFGFLDVSYPCLCLEGARIGGEEWVVVGSSEGRIVGIGMEEGWREDGGKGVGGWKKEGTGGGGVEGAYRGGDVEKLVYVGKNKEIWSLGEDGVVCVWSVSISPSSTPKKSKSLLSSSLSSSPSLAFKLVDRLGGGGEEAERVTDLAKISKSKICTVSADQTVVIYDSKWHVCLQKVRNVHEDVILCVGGLRGGKGKKGEGGIFWTGSLDGTLLMWSDCKEKGRKEKFDPWSLGSLDDDSDSESELVMVEVIEKKEERERRYTQCVSPLVKPEKEERRKRKYTK